MRCTKALKPQNELLKSFEPMVENRENFQQNGYHAMMVLSVGLIMAIEDELRFYDNRNGCL